MLVRSIPCVLATMLAVMLVVGACDKQPTAVDAFAASAVPHQDEWWPYADASKAPEPESHSNETQLTEAERIARAKKNWLADRPQLALSDLANVSSPDYQLLRKTIEGPVLRRMGYADEAMRRLSDTAPIAANRRLIAARDNNRGWAQLTSWLIQTRAGSSPSSPTSAGLSKSASPESASVDFQKAADGNELLGILNAASLAMMRGHLEETQRYLEKFRERVGKQTPSHLARTYQALRGELAMRRGDWIQASDAFTDALRLTNASQAGPTTADAYLSMVAGIAASEVRRSEESQTLLKSAIETFRASATTATESRKAVLSEQARRAAMHLAIAKIRALDGSGDRDSRQSAALGELAASVQNDASTWQGLLALMLAGERPVARVLASVPANLSPARRIDAQTQASLAAARRYVLAGKNPEAMQLLSNLPSPIEGCDGLERALAMKLLGGLKSGEITGRIP